MAQSDARFGYRAKLDRTDHDLNQPFGFSAAPGMLLPVAFDLASPGDSYYIKHDLDFLRTAPLAAPAMVDVLVHYESFFVPMQLLYQPFENTMFSLTEQFSTAFTDINFQNNNFPLFDYYYYISQICSANPNGSQRTLSFRLADMLDLQALNFCQSNVTLDSNSEYFVADEPDYHYHPSFFPWQILAYNCIYQYYYRLDDKSVFDNTTFNYDSEYSNTGKVRTTNGSFMTIRQRPWNFDYFTSSYRSPLVSNPNVQSILPSSSYSSLVAANTRPINNLGQGSPNNEQIRSYGGQLDATYTPQNVNLQASTAAIRQMFANEKLAMITGRTRKNYDSQVLAHFGVKVPHDVKHEITMIGHDTYRLHVGEVTSLASTSGSSLGDLAGKGYASGKGHDIKFTAPCHGVIMTIFSIEPQKRYYAGFNRVNAVSNAFDLPIPEFDRLGNQPIYQYETGSAQSFPTVQSMTAIAGWKERYYQWKRRKSRVSLAFMHGSSYQLSTNEWAPYFISSWAFGRHNATMNSTPNDSSRYYIDVECMDDLMLVPMRLSWGTGGTTSSPDEDWNAHPYLAYSHDPFIVDSNVKMKKVSWMSKDGEPIYNF